MKDGRPPVPPPNREQPNEMPPEGMNQPFDELLIKATFQFNKGTANKTNKVIEGNGEN